MPGPKYADVKHSLACGLAERGIVLPSRKLKAFTAIFIERMKYNEPTDDDIKRYVLDYQDPTGEEAVKNVMTPKARVVRLSAPSGNRDADHFRPTCPHCGWSGVHYSNRTIEGRRLAERDAERHRCPSANDVVEDALGVVTW